MAWPIDTDAEENVEENVTSSTDRVNEPPNHLQNMYMQGAVGFSPSNERRQNQIDTSDLRVANPYINRIRNGRRHSVGDINPSTARASGSNYTNIAQRHSVTCCHLNPNVRHSCCLHLNRRLSLENLNIHRRNSFPQNDIHDHYNSETTILNPYGQFPAIENQTANGPGINFDYERQRSFSVGRSFLFGNENFQADSYLQQAVSAGGPEFFMRFLADEMDRRGMQLPDDMHRDMGPSGEMPPLFTYLLDRFSSSLEREMIFYLTKRVQLPINLNSFIAIVDGMNKGTAAPERIVTLFFFCADLAIRALCEGNATLFREIVSWTLGYLQSSDSLVAVPSKRSTYRITVTACVIGLIAVVFLMKRN